jgi:2'-5' RNA ligase superfamily protein
MGRGLALWLLPEPRAFARLSDVIAEIARTGGSPRFEPHVTLLSGIALEAAEVIERARTLAAVFTPQDVLLARAAQRPDFFQALFLEVEGGDLDGGRRRAAVAMGMTPTAEYRPHLSLLYGDRTVTAKDAILDRIGRGWNEPCLLDRLAIVSPEGPPESWTRAVTVPLGPP